MRWKLKADVSMLLVFRWILGADANSPSPVVVRSGTLVSTPEVFFQAPGLRGIDMHGENSGLLRNNQRNIYLWRRPAAAVTL